MRYPRNIQLHNTGDRHQIFTFKDEQEYIEKQKEGWCFNPANVEDRKSPEIVEEKEEEIKIHKPETPTEPILKIDETTEALQCDQCDFKGKSVVSLRMHKLHKHKVK